MEIYGLNKGEIDDYFSRIDAISLEEANVIAKKYYRDLNLQFCLLGNASKIQDSVKKYAPKMKVLSIKEPGFDPHPSKTKRGPKPPRSHIEPQPH